jgi:hypothetical protein
LDLIIYFFLYRYFSLYTIYKLEQIFTHEISILQYFTNLNIVYIHLLYPYLDIVIVKMSNSQNIIFHICMNSKYKRRNECQLSYTRFPVPFNECIYQLLNEFWPTGIYTPRSHIGVGHTKFKVPIAKKSSAQCLYTYWRCAPPIMGWFEDFFSYIFCMLNLVIFYHYMSWPVPSWCNLKLQQ